MDTREQKDKELFDNIAPKYAIKDIYKSTRLARQYQLDFVIKSILNQQENLGHLLDVACGVGAPAEYLNGKYKSYLGIDQSKTEIELARKIYKDKNNIHFIAENIKSIKLNEKVDNVIALGALHHMTNFCELRNSLLTNKLG